MAQDQATGSYEDVFIPLPTFAAFQRQFRIACFTAIVLMASFAFIPQIVPPVMETGFIFRNLGAGVLAYLAVDCLKCRWDAFDYNLFPSCPPSRQWLLRAFPAAVWAIAIELVRLLVVFICLAQFQDHPTASSYWLGLGLAIGESGVRNFAFLADTYLYKSILMAAATSTESDFSALEAYSDYQDNAEQLQDNNVAEFLGPATAVEELGPVQDEEIHRAWVEDEKRVGIEEALGHPLFDMPAFLLVLWTIDTLLFSIAVTLLLVSNLLPFAAMAALVVLLRVVQAVVWSLFTPLYGLSGVSYGACLFNLLLFFAALASHGIIR